MKAILCKSYGPPENLVLEEVQDLNPKEGEVGNCFLKEEPKQIQEMGKTIWKLSLKDDIFSDGSDSIVVNLLYKYFLGGKQEYSKYFV